MSDTNWCTFCDCAVSTTSNSIYCSEECFERDACNHHPFYIAYIDQQQAVKKQNVNTVRSTIEPMATPPPLVRRRLSSEDLSVMYFDMTPPSRPNEETEPILLVSPNAISTQPSTPSPPPLLSSYFSPASSHYDLTLGTPTKFSHGLSFTEKLNSMPARTTLEPLHGVPERVYF